MEMTAIDPTEVLSEDNRPTFEIEHEPEIAWVFLNRPGHRPNCNVEMLKGVRTFLNGLHGDHGIRYLVMGSKFPGVFNLGGDLHKFVEWAEQDDRESLLEYGLLCIDLIDIAWNSCQNSLINIALVQGDAMGGGFETVLCHDVVIAEKQARFALPEIKFGLFPGMGAQSFLARRIGHVEAKRMLSSGLVYSAADMHALGVVDILVDDGEGEAAVREYIASTKSKYGGHLAIAKASRLVDPVTKAELEAIVRVWVDRVLELSPFDLKVMSRIVQAQNRLS